MADLVAKRRSPMHLKHVKCRLIRLIAEAGWKHPAQITAQSFTEWRSKVTGLGPKTLNEYFGHASAFATWLVRQGRLPVNPLLSVGKIETAGSERLVRRALSDDELNRLVMASGSRGLAYLLAASTGLRRGELNALIWGDLHLDEVEPFLVARAGTTKNRKTARLPLHPEMVEVLRMTAAKTKPSPEMLVFPDGVPSMLWFKRDANSAEIVLTNTQGQRADFHALRHTLATRLNRANVPPRIAMELMRHSDMRLTMKTYTDAGSLPMASELGKLPRLLPSLPGTLNSGKACLNESQPVQSMVAEKIDQPVESQEERPDLTGGGQPCLKQETGGEGGIRTPGRDLNPYNALAKRRYRPLSHLSESGCRGKRGSGKVQGGFLRGDAQLSSSTGRSSSSRHSEMTRSQISRRSNSLGSVSSR